MQSNSAPPLDQAERWNRLISSLDDQQMRALFRVAYSVLKNKEDAKDVLQEALIIGATNYHKLRNPNKLFSWMYSIVRREAIAYYREFSLKALITRARIAYTLSNDDNSTEAQIIEKYRKEQLSKAIDNLQSPAKEILLMHIVDDMDFVQIAEALDLNYHTVRSRYRRTIKELRSILEDDNHA